MQEILTKIIFFLNSDISKIILVLIIGLFAYGSLSFYFKRSINLIKRGSLMSREIESERIKTLEKVFISIFRFLTIIVVVLLIFSVFKIDINVFLASLGIAGLAIGIGAKSLIEDYIKGIFVLIEDQYRVGEEIKGADIKGKVVDFNLRKTVLEENGILHYIPNSQIKKVSNFSRKKPKIRKTLSRKKT